MSDTFETTTAMGLRLPDDPHSSPPAGVQFAPTQRPLRRKSIGAQIRKHFANGKWVSVATVAKKLDANEDHVRATLERCSWKNTNYHGLRSEKKPVGRGWEYRIWIVEKPVGREELIEKLRPIAEALKIEGKKNMTTMSPQVVAVLAHRLQILLDEWTQ
jgi:hypothetical protein